MAFLFKKVSNSAVLAPTIKQLAATSGVSYEVGDALKITSGKAALAGATDAPKYICVEEKTAGSGDTISAYLVEGNQEYETTLSTDGTLAVGVKYTLHTDSAQVTATSTSGVAEVVSVSGTTAGSKVVVKF